MARQTTKESVNHLRAWREKVGLSQDELAKLVDTKGNVIGLLESGERGLSDKWLRKLAPIFGITPGHLLDHHPDDLDSAYINEALKVPRERRELAVELLKTLKVVSK